MFNEATMDATRRMLLKQNKIDYDEDETFCEEHIDIVTMDNKMDHTEELPKTRIARKDESLDSSLIIPSLMKTKRRRSTYCWSLKSIHHPRLPLLTLGKYELIAIIKRIRNVLFMETYFLKPRYPYFLHC